MTPAKGTPEYALWIAAVEVAASAPFKQSERTAMAQVYWPRIHALREALDGVGVDWRAVKAADEAQRRAHRG